MNALTQTDPPVAISQVPHPYPNGYPPEDWPYTLFFNGEEMPQYSFLWYPISELVRDRDDDAAVGGKEVAQVIWDLESLGLVKSCAPAIFVFAIQELLLFALQRPQELQTALQKTPVSARAEEVVGALIEGGFKMRELTLKQRRAYWSLGYQEWDLPALRQKMADAFDLPAAYVLPPHQEHRKFYLKCRLESQTTLFHELAQSSQYPKDMRRRLHAVTVPDGDFLRLII